MSKKIKRIKIIDPGTAPDVDSDFHTDGRFEVIKYVQDKYGIDNVASIITPGPFKAKNAFKSVSTIYDLNFALANNISTTLPDSTSKDTIADYLDPNNPAGEDFRLKLSNPTLEKIATDASKLDGRLRESGVHACGILISSEPINNTVPTHIRQKDGLTVTQWNYYNCEALGLIKMDFLGLDTVTLIDDTLKNIKMTKNIDIDLNSIVQGDLNDEKTYQLFQRADTEGIFQFSSQGVKEMLKELQPTEFMDLATVTALYRPGPMGMNAHKEFAIRKNNPEARIPANEKSFIGTKVEEILANTYGLCAFQEQVMIIAKECAGFTAREADDLRKAIGKKKIDLMNSLGGKFKEGMILNGYNKKAVENLWEGIVAFGSYAFNKSHSVSYAINAYISGYLKANYPLEFMAAVLKRKIINKKEINTILAEVKRMKITIEPANINESNDYIIPSTHKNSIIYGLSGIKSFPVEVATGIIEERTKNGKFKSLSDFILRLLPLNILTPNTLELLAKAGAFDCFNISRKFVVENASKLIKLGHRHLANANKPSLFAIVNDNSQVELLTPTTDDYDYGTQAKFEADSTGFFFTKHPLDKIKQKEYNLNEINGSIHNLYVTISNVETKVTRKKFKLMFLTLDNKSSRVELQVDDAIVKGIDKGKAIATYKDKVYEKLKIVNDPEKIYKFEQLQVFTEPIPNQLYKVSIQVPTFYNKVTGKTFGKPKIVDLSPVILSKDGFLVTEIQVPDKNKENLYIKKLKENVGTDVVRLCYPDNTFVDIEGITFMPGTTQYDLSLI